jgi:hypothetical protein
MILNEHIDKNINSYITTLSKFIIERFIINNLYLHKFIIFVIKNLEYLVKTII